MVGARVDGDADELLSSVRTTTTWGGHWAEFVVFLARLQALGYSGANTDEIVVAAGDSKTPEWARGVSGGGAAAAAAAAAAESESEFEDLTPSDPGEIKRLALSFARDRPDLFSRLPESLVYQLIDWPLPRRLNNRKLNAGLQRLRASMSMDVSHLRGKCSACDKINKDRQENPALQLSDLLRVLLVLNDIEDPDEFADLPSKELASDCVRRLLRLAESPKPPPEEMPIDTSTVSTAKSNPRDEDRSTTDRLATTIAVAVAAAAILSEAKGETTGEEAVDRTKEETTGRRGSNAAMIAVDTNGEETTGRRDLSAETGTIEERSSEADSTTGARTIASATAVDAAVVDTKVAVVVAAAVAALTTIDVNPSIGSTIVRRDSSAETAVVAAVTSAAASKIEANASAVAAAVALAVTAADASATATAVASATGTAVDLKIAAAVALATGTAVAAADVSATAVVAVDAILSAIATTSTIAHRGALSTIGEARTGANSVVVSTIAAPSEIPSALASVSTTTPVLATTTKATAPVRSAALSTTTTVVRRRETIVAALSTTVDDRRLAIPANAGPRTTFKSGVKTPATTSTAAAGDRAITCLIRVSSSFIRIRSTFFHASAFLENQRKTSARFPVPGFRRLG